jgi:hypothetical protein
MSEQNFKIKKGLNVGENEIITADGNITLPVGATINVGGEPLDALPDQTDNSGKFLTTDGSNATWDTITQYTPATDQGATNYLAGDGTYKSISYVDIADVPTNVINKETYTATEGQTAFAIIHQLGQVDVYLNGIRLTETVDFTGDGTTVTLTDPASADDIVSLFAMSDLATFIDNTLTSDGDGTLFLSDDGSYKFVDALPTQSGNAGKYLTTDGTTASWNTLTATNLDLTGNTLTYTNTSGVDQVIDLSPYLDDTTNTVISASLSANVITFTREDSTTFDIDVSDLSPDYAMSLDTVAVGDTLTIPAGKQLVVDHLDVQGEIDVQGTLATTTGGYLSQTTMKTQVIENSANAANPVDFAVIPTINGESLDLLPDQTGNNGKYLSTDGTAPSWEELSIPTLTSLGIDNHDQVTVSGTGDVSISGDADAGAVTSNSAFFVNPTVINNSYTIPDGHNAMTAGPITVADNVTITVPVGSTWTIV